MVGGSFHFIQRELKFEYGGVVERQFHLIKAAEGFVVSTCRPLYETSSYLLGLRNWYHPICCGDTNDEIVFCNECDMCHHRVRMMSCLEYDRLVEEKCFRRDCAIPRVNESCLKLVKAFES